MFAKKNCNSFIMIILLYVLKNVCKLHHVVLFSAKSSSVQWLPYADTVRQMDWDIDGAGAYSAMLLFQG